jgi:hypothetical protein
MANIGNRKYAQYLPASSLCRLNNMSKLLHIFVASSGKIHDDYMARGKF